VQDLGEDPAATAAPIGRLVARFDRRCDCCREDKRWGTKSPRYRLELPPGTYSKVPAWLSRSWWLATVLPAAITRGRDVLRRHHIAPDTFTRIMAIHAMHADDQTGRGVTIDVEHLRLEERIEAYERGSRQRGFASVYALGCPTVLARHLPQPLTPVPAHPQLNTSPGERGTPPVGIPSRSFSSRRSHGSSATSADELATLDASTPEGGPGRAAAGPAEPRRRANHSPTDTPKPNPARPPRPPHGPDRPRPARRSPRWNPEARRLAEALRREIPALRHTPTGRLVPAVTRFAKSPTHWDVAQLVALIWHAARTKGWTTRPEKIRQPAAWLAHLLQGINDTNPEDLPRDHPDHPDRQNNPAPTEISPDDPWADTLRPTTTGGGGTQVATPAPTDQATRRRGLTLWETHDRREREVAADTERAALRANHAQLQAELRGENLCPHGASGADERDRSPRCATCRHQP
jgi:hypothetical protein